ncbi:hypothetical protein AbHV_ORF66 [Abalone herpesvirus Victoria/AUS/2009]|uniref:Uncharacterized protein n=1 Tax=Abalone herpesvirus (isolate Abalone/Australia/Victoria/2009) TaxID=1241371 RepID=K4JYI3_ABHV|nr:hypothetical protein AbHV_ORF66 [Abalone herpesvirus Victoria/AUS/2009]AFU90078.1 hypothetical protein AbHV_ORF66 [Abalone herpesvirus Victoria/AUS/2009]
MMLFLLLVSGFVCVNSQMGIINFNLEAGTFRAEYWMRGRGLSASFHNAHFHYNSTSSVWAMALSDLFTSIPGVYNNVNSGISNGGVQGSFDYKFPVQGDEKMDFINAFGGSDWSLTWGSTMKVKMNFGSIVGWNSTEEVKVILKAVDNDHSNIVLGCGETHVVEELLGSLPSSNVMKPNLKFYKNGEVIYDGDLYARSDSGESYTCSPSPKTLSLEGSKQTAVAQNEMVRECWNQDRLCGDSGKTVIGNNNLFRFSSDGQRSQFIDEFGILRLYGIENSSSEGPFLINDEVLLTHPEFSALTGNETLVSKELMSGFLEGFLLGLQQYEEYEYFVPTNEIATGDGVLLIMLTAVAHAGFTHESSIADACGSYKAVWNYGGTIHADDVPTHVMNVIFRRKRATPPTFFRLPMTYNRYQKRNIHVTPCEGRTDGNVGMIKTAQDRIDAFCALDEVTCAVVLHEQVYEIAKQMHLNRCGCYTLPNYCKQFKDESNKGVIVTFTVPRGLLSDTYSCSINDRNSGYFSEADLIKTASSERCTYTFAPSIKVLDGGDVFISCLDEGTPASCRHETRLVTLYEDKLYLLKDRYVEGFIVNPHRLATLVTHVFCIDTKDKIKGAKTIKKLRDTIRQDNIHEVDIYMDENSNHHCTLTTNDVGTLSDYSGLFTMASVSDGMPTYLRNVTQRGLRFDIKTTADRVFKQRKCSFIKGNKIYHDDRTKLKHDAIYAFETETTIGCAVTHHDDFGEEFEGNMVLNAIHTDRFYHAFNDGIEYVPYDSANMTDDGILIQLPKDGDLINDYVSGHEAEGFVFTCGSSVRSVYRYDIKPIPSHIKPLDFSNLLIWKDSEGIPHNTTDVIATTTTPGFKPRPTHVVIPVTHEDKLMVKQVIYVIVMIGGAIMIGLLTLILITMIIICVAKRR